MAKTENPYPINILYPKTGEGMLEIRKRLGETYVDFVKEYILALPVSDKEKNEIYTRVLERLVNGK